MFRKVILLSLLFCLPVLFAQDQNWNERIQKLSFTETISDYRLGPGDLIQVDVFGVEGFGRNLRINSSGTITVPYIGAVKAAALTTIELEERLSEMLDGRFIKNPQVTVLVAEYRSQSVFVLGAVTNPGQYQLTQPLRLIDVIGMAGGLNLETADTVAIVQKKGATNGPDANGTTPVRTQETLRIDLTELLENGKLDLNTPISGGDVVQVPERQIERYYVIGDVNRPGAYELPRDEELFVTQALAQAGGPLRTAKTSKGLLVRIDDKGQRQEVALNVDDIVKGKKPDMTLLPNDVIFLPGSTAKSIGYGLLGIIPGTLSNTIVWGTVR